MSYSLHGHVQYYYINLSVQTASSQHIIVTAEPHCDLSAIKTQNDGKSKLNYGKSKLKLSIFSEIRNIFKKRKEFWS